MKLVLTCEHATNYIPPEYTYMFTEAGEILNTHRGYDPGAFGLFSRLIPLSNAHFSCEISRLLVEVNRSIGHPSLFSEFTQQLSKEEKKKILQAYYFSYRNEVEENIAEKIKEGERVLHFSVHSFTPTLNGVVRNADLGLLYDPQREEEKDFCRNFKKNFQNLSPEFSIRFNYPYLGIADGFTTYLRKKFPKYYLGIEIEVNQKFVMGNLMEENIKSGIFSALQECLQNR